VSTLCVVSTLYGSEERVQEFLRRTDCALDGLDFSEIRVVLIDDGSNDRSVDRALSYEPSRFDLEVVCLSRNYGHHKAIFTGLGECREDTVVLLDSDLEEPPELIPRMLEKFAGDDLDVLYGVQRVRRDRGLLDRLSLVGYRILESSKRTKVTRNLCTMRVMNARYVAALLEYREQNPSFSLISKLVGFRQGVFEVDKGDNGVSVYSWRKRFKNFANALIGHVDLGFRVALVALLLLISMLVAAVAIIFPRALTGEPPSGYLSIIAVSLFGFASIAVVLFVFAIYLERIYREVLGRPRVHVQDRAIIRRGSASDEKF